MGCGVGAGCGLWVWGVRCRVGVVCRVCLDMGYGVWGVLGYRLGWGIGWV